MKIPSIVIILGLALVGLFLVRSILSTIKFSAKLLTWGVVLFAGIGAAIFFLQDADDNVGLQPDGVEYQTQNDSPVLR